MPVLMLGQADHLVFSRIVIAPDEAEMVEIINPTDESISLSNYYLTDATDADGYYYNLPTGADYWSENFFDFICKFPDTLEIDSDDTLLIAINTSENFVEYYGYIPDLSLVDGDLMNVSDESTIGAGIPSSGAFNESQETLILFYWDGNPSSKIKDVDYFLWSGNNFDQDDPTTHPLAINKDGVEGYVADTPIEQQSYIRKHGADSSYIRIELDEIEENLENGNGITGNDETSENLILSWNIIPNFETGCTDPNAINYNSNATMDDGSCCYGEIMDDGSCCDGQISEDNFCFISIQEIINNCGDDMGEELECDGQYNLSDESAAECSMYETQVTTTGVIVDYFDITPYGGPHSFTIQDDSGGQIDFVVWPESSDYQDGFDIIQSDLYILTIPPFSQYQVEITGELGAYCDDDELLDINSEWQITVEYEVNITIKEYEVSEEFLFEVAPYPFIPSIGERIKYTYLVPSGYRCIIRIFDLSGRFITTLFDGMPNYINTGDHYWDGRTHLGELIIPGTYIMHLEATEFTSGNSHISVAPIVIGVK